MSEAKLTKDELRQFTGSEQWYRHGLVRSVLFTDGAKYVADQGGALLAARRDRLGAARQQPRRRRGISGVAAQRQAGQDGDPQLRRRQRSIVFEKAIPFTDFPLDEIELWFTNNTIYLPSEH